MMVEHVIRSALPTAVDSASSAGSRIWVSFQPIVKHRPAHSHFTEPLRASPSSAQSSPSGRMSWVAESAELELDFGGLSGELGRLDCDDYLEVEVEDRDGRLIALVITLLGGRDGTINQGTGRAEQARQSDHDDRPRLRAQ